jgi:hypothetical protein
MWLNSYRAEKEKAQKVQRYQRGEGGGAGRAGDASTGKASGEQEAIQERQAQAQPGQTTGGCGSVRNGSWLLAFGSPALAFYFPLFKTEPMVCFR